MTLSRNVINAVNDVSLAINDNIVVVTESVTILGIEINKKLNFSTYVDNISSKASKQINSFDWMKCYLDNECNSLHLL